MTRIVGLRLVVQLNSNYLNDKGLPHNNGNPLFLKNNE